jgi:capsular polysaccharide biosynthesis protein
LDESHGVLAKWNFNGEYRGNNASSHDLTVVELAEGKIVADLRLAASRCDIVAGGIQGIYGCDRPQDHYSLHRRRFRLNHHWHGTALLLGAVNSSNYYHWLLDSLPRWKMLQDAGYTHTDYDYVLLHSKPRRFQDETLNRLNVPEEKRLRCNKNFIHHFDRLVVPAMPFPLWQVTPWTCEWLSSLFPERRGGPERIYLSRRDVARRRFTNEAELEAQLEGMGFVCVQPAKMSVAEQAAALSAAKWVVAPHGAGLANLAFTPPGAKVIELVHPVNQTPCYKHLALAHGLGYTSVAGTTRELAHHDDRDAEFTIEIAHVLRLLSENE